MADSLAAPSYLGPGYPSKSGPAQLPPRFGLSVLSLAGWSAPYAGPFYMKARLARIVLAGVVQIVSYYLFRFSIRKTYTANTASLWDAVLLSCRS
jgi:hypothetical protein